VHATDVHGNTPLFVAVLNSRGRGDLIALLRAYGADQTQSNGAGQTPIGLAHFGANYDVLRSFTDQTWVVCRFSPLTALAGQLSAAAMRLPLRHLATYGSPNK
jgi:hypothetical protein